MADFMFSAGRNLWRSGLEVLFHQFVYLHSRDPLLQLSGNQEDGTQVMATQQDLADLVGVSRVSLGEAMTRLQVAGVIEPGYGFVTIRDRRALREMGAG